MEQETYLERIKKLKSSRKLTNDKLSEMTGIPLGTLSKLLAGISDSPKLSNIVAISRALDCSLDWLITGVPENTNNYTLTFEEMNLIEDYRALDVYGRELTALIIGQEKRRTERQTDEEAIRFHDMARRSTRRGGTRARRTPDVRPSVDTPAVAPTGIPSQDVPRVAGGSGAGVYRYTPASPAEVTAQTPPPSPTAGAVAEGGAQILSVPRSVPDRSGNLPAGLRRRTIGLYDMPVSAGVGEFLSDSARSDIVIPDDPRTVEADYALRINGDSMEPKYHSGDILLIQTAEAVEEGELGIFVLDGMGYFKKYGGDHLLSLNTKYPPIRLKDFSEIACCGRVVGKLKRK